MRVSTPHYGSFYGNTRNLSLVIPSTRSIFHLEALAYNFKDDFHRSGSGFSSALRLSWGLRNFSFRLREKL